MNQAQYRPDNKGMAQLATSRGIQDAMVAAGRRGQSFAESIAPVGRTGVYSSSFQVLPATTVAGRPRGPRAAARLENYARHAIVVERRQQVLARSVDAIRGRRR